MPQKPKIPPSEKIRIVQEYLAGTLTQSECKQKHGICSWTLEDWIRLYKLRGAKGLMPASKNRHYSPEIKRQAVEEYLSGKGSQSYICTKYDISDKHMLRNWIMRYNSHEEFKQPNIGGATHMAKGRKTTLEERIEIVSHCIANNKDYGKAMEQYGVSYQQIYGWVRKYEEYGSMASLTAVENAKTWLR